MARGGDLVLLLADGGVTLRTPGQLAQVVSLAQKVAVVADQLFQNTSIMILCFLKLTSRRQAGCQCTGPLCTLCT